MLNLYLAAVAAFHVAAAGGFLMLFGTSKQRLRDVIDHIRL
jgi:hypothetical protein